MSDDRRYRLAYSRDYNAGAKRAWPEYRPPEPPNEIVADLMRAARELRNGVDNFIATIDEDDEVAKELGPLIDEVDRQFIRITEWLRAKEPEATP